MSSGSSDSDSSSADTTIRRKIGLSGAESYKEKSVTNWSIKEVAGWLSATGYQNFVQKFVDEMVDGETLLTLSSADLSNLGFKKIGERNKLVARIAKLKTANRAASSRTESSSSISQSDDGGERVKIVATLKKKTAEIEVSQTITLDDLLEKLAQEFGQRVKVRVLDGDGEPIAVANDDELADALDGEDEVEMQCIKDLKAAKGKDGTKKKRSSSSSSEEKKASISGVNFDLFDSMLDGYCAIDEDGVVLYFNPAAEKMFGFARRKVVGQNVKMLMPDSYAKKHDTYLARYATTGQKHIIGMRRVVMAKAANNSMFPLELAVTEKQQNGATYFVAAMKLMTEPGKASSSGSASTAAPAAGKDELADVRKTLEQVQEAAIVINETGRIMIFNAAATTLFGHPASAVLGQPVEMLMGEPHKSNHAFYLSRYIATGHKTVMGSSRDVSAIHADGTTISVNLALSEEKASNGDPLFVGLLVPSVKHGGPKTGAETTLQSLRKMINTMSVAGVIINEKGIMQAFNKSAEDMLGYQLIDAVGRNVTMIMNEADAAKHDEYLQNYLRTGEARVIGKERTLQARHKNGQLIDIMLSITEHVDSPGKKLFVGMMHLSKSALDKKKKERKSSSSSSSSKKKDDGATTSGDTSEGSKNKSTSTTPK